MVGVLALRALPVVQLVLEGGRVQFAAVEMIFDEQSIEGLLGNIHDWEEYRTLLLRIGPHVLEICRS